MKRERTSDERDYFRRITRVGRPASPLDDPEKRAESNAEWDRKRECEEEMQRTRADPYFTRLREAARATGGESCNPDREPHDNEER